MVLHFGLLMVHSASNVKITQETLAYQKVLYATFRDTWLIKSEIESKVVVKSTPPRHQQRFKPNTPIIKATQSEQVSFNSLNESCMNSPLSDYVANSQEEATIPETLPILSPTPDKENISPESTKKRSRKETNTPLSMTKTLSMITPRSSGKKSKKLNRRSSLRSTASQEATPVVNPTATLTELSTSGTHPVGRWGHTATSLGTSKRIILYGGDGDEETSLGDLHVLDLGKWKNRCSPSHTAHIFSSFE